MNRTRHSMFYLKKFKWSIFCIWLNAAPFCGPPWVVHPPMFLPLQLNHKRLDVVIMGSKALRPRWCQVSGSTRTKYTDLTVDSSQDVYPRQSLSKILTRWLLPCCQSTPGEWTAHSTLWRRTPEDSANGGSSRSGKWGHDGDKKHKHTSNGYLMNQCGLTS